MLGTARSSRGLTSRLPLSQFTTPSGLDTLDRYISHQQTQRTTKKEAFKNGVQQDGPRRGGAAARRARAGGGPSGGGRGDLQGEV